MKLLFFLCVCAASALLMQTSAAVSEVVIASRIVDESVRSLLVDVRATPDQAVDEVLLDLPRNAGDSAVLSTAPAGWRLEHEGHSIRLAGPAAHAPIRLRITVFDLAPVDRLRTRIRSLGRDLFDAQVPSTELSHFRHSATTSGWLEAPGVVNPGETLEMKLFDPAHTPADGQWFVAGVAAKFAAPDRIRLELPSDLPARSPLRISYFDRWGERIVDSLSVEDTSVVANSSASPGAPQISGCAPYSFIGQSVCVCGNFPEGSWSGIRLDGQPATITAASRHVLRVALPGSLAPGTHEITGDFAVGFSEKDKVLVLALRLLGSIDSNALLRGQSTTLRLAIGGTSEPMTIAVTNLTPGVISIPGGNHQEITTSGGTNNAAERRVDATSRGNFQINYYLEGARCPCEATPTPDAPSAASRPDQVIVPRRVLATIAVGTPAAMYTTAQALATANGLAVLEVSPLTLTNEGLVVFEILDGVSVATKVIALAADPRVTLAQPEIVYDTSQGGSVSADLIYGPRMIEADTVRSVARGDGIRLGIIDTGIDDGNLSLHQKLAEFADVTGTGWTPDVHGSLVAGIIGADSGNGSGPQGVAPGAKLIGVKSCVAQSSRTAEATCWSSTLTRGMDAAVQRNVRIINMSVGGPDDRLLARTVDAAMKRGIVIVSAAGNDGPSGKPSYPAAFRGVIAVTAVDASANLYSRATRGVYVSLAAPGVDIVSTGPGGKSQAFSGTSAATAFVSGAVALLLQQQSNLSPPDLQNLLEQTAKPLGPTIPNPEYGYGLVDVCQATAKLGKRTPVCR